MARKIFAVYDLKSMTILGAVLMMHKHDAPAIRDFNDALSDDRGIFSKHPEDYNLLCLGDIDDEGSIIPAGPRVVLTGEAWASARNVSSQER